MSKEEMYSRFIGKVVAVKGIGSGVNMGVCLAIDGVDVLLDENSCFLCSWAYDETKSYGAMHSLSRGDIAEGGTITKNDAPTLICDASQIVICTTEAMETALKSAR